MKKFTLLLFVLFALMITTAGLAQQINEPEPTELAAPQADVVDVAPANFTEPALAPDGSLIPPGDDLMHFFAMFGALLPLVVSITAFLVNRFTLKPTAKQITAWAVSIGLSFAGWWLQIGYLTDITWWMALVHGAALGLAANGFFDIAIIKAILNAIFPPSKK